MTANERQVGGDHYKTGGIELWDLFGPESIIFYAVRYLQRWRKKDGVQDLEKALHCVQKLREIAPRHAMRNVLTVDDSLFESWLENSSLGAEERSIIRRLVIWWRSDPELAYASASIQYLIAKERLATKQADAATGVTTDEVEYFIGGYGKRDTAGLKYSEMTDGEIIKEQSKRIRVRENFKEESLGPDRRVPRYDAVPRLRSQDDLAPWQIDGATYKAWSKDNAVRHAALIAFYKMVTRDLYRLEPHARSKVIPRELHACYARPLDADQWLLRVDRVPPSLRECYPSLRSKMNAVEYDQLLDWQRGLYEPRPEDGGYNLQEAHAAWRVEEEV